MAYLGALILYGARRPGNSIIRAPNPSRFRIRVRFIPGVLVVLFFKCVAALLNPVYRRGEPIKYGLVSYTAVMFLVVTVENVIDIHT